MLPCYVDLLLSRYPAILSPRLTMAREIIVEQLAKSYRQKRVVDGVSLDVKEGEVVGLLGPNGAGKTTTFYMIVGLTRPDEGRVFLNGVDVTRAPMHVRARGGIGYLPQEASVFRKLTVEENILAILQMTRRSRRERRELCGELLRRLDIEKVRKQKGYTLSGGERRRTEIARALATSPSFILLDEPFTGVEPMGVQEIQDIIAALRQDGIGILITDHNVRDTLAITDRAYILCEGKILTAGSSAELPNDPIARRFYLGERYNG